MTRCLISGPMREMTVFDAVNAPDDLLEAWCRLVQVYCATVPREAHLVELVNIACRGYSLHQEGNGTFPIDLR